MAEEVSALLGIVTDIEVEWPSARQSLTDFLIFWSDIKHTQNDLLTLSSISNTITDSTKLLKSTLHYNTERIEEQKSLKQLLERSKYKQIPTTKSLPSNSGTGTGLHQGNLRRKILVDLAWEYINLLRARVSNVKKFFAKKLRAAHSGFCVDYSEIACMVVGNVMAMLEVCKAQEVLLVMEFDNQEEVMELCIIDEKNVLQLMPDSYVHKICNRVGSACHGKEILGSLKKFIFRIKRNKT